MLNSNPNRLHVVDALRGFAIVSILLLHNIEHFDLYYKPEGLAWWIERIDQGIWDTLFFLFGGKSYAIFALLFGLTFHIQSENQRLKGKAFSLRFAWRMVLLLAFGLFNSVFYQGDILTIYAILGLFLVFVEKWSTKTLWWLAIIFMLQPYEWLQLVNGIIHPIAKLNDPLSWSYFGKMESYVTGPSFTDTAIGNLTNGKLAVINWTWENGRVFQTLSLFLLGIIAGKESIFSTTNKNKQLYKSILISAVIAFIPLFIFKNNLSIVSPYQSVIRPLSVIISSWSNMAFMLILVSTFVILYHKNALKNTLNIFAPIGQMSLSNYIIQSILGTILYYGFGFGLYQYTGATYSLLIGIVLIIIQYKFSLYWMLKHKHGPLETIWHNLTWGIKK